MGDLLVFIAKLLLASAVLALAIKSVGPLLPIPVTATSALVAAIAPPLLIAIALGWRAWKQG